jgi:phytoene synthase
MDETPQENVSFSYDLGIFFAILHEIQELRHSIEKNRLYFPLTTLSRFELTLESLKKELSGKEKNPGLLPFLKEEATLARSYYEKALRALPSEKKRIYAPHLIHGALMMSLLDTLEKEGFNLLTHQTRLTPLQNYWIARKTFKRVKR